MEVKRSDITQHSANNEQNPLDDYSKFQPFSTPFIGCV